MADHVMEIDELVMLISGLLADQPEEVQGCALADCVAMWLAGHVVRGDPKATDKVREQMLELHLKAVRMLVPVNHRDHIEPLLKEMEQ